MGKNDLCLSCVLKTYINSNSSILVDWIKQQLLEMNCFWWRVWLTSGTDHTKEKYFWTKLSTVNLLWIERVHWSRKTPLCSKRQIVTYTLDDRKVFKDTNRSSISASETKRTGVETAVRCSGVIWPPGVRIYPCVKAPVENVGHR